MTPGRDNDHDFDLILLCSLFQHSVIGASFDDRSTIVQQEFRWTTSFRASDELTKIKGPNNKLMLNYQLLYTII